MGFGRPRFMLLSCYLEMLFRLLVESLLEEGKPRALYKFPLPFILDYDNYLSLDWLPPPPFKRDLSSISASDLFYDVASGAKIERLPLDLWLLATLSNTESMLLNAS